MSSTGRYSHTPVPEPVPEEPQTVAPDRGTTARLARWLILAGLLILLVWAGLKAWRIYQASSSLLSIQEKAGVLLAGGIQSADPDIVEALVLSAREDVAVLHEELGFIRPIAPLLGWIPQAGPLLEASPYLLEMADAGSEAGATAVTALKPALAIVQRDDFSAARLGELLPVFSAAIPDLEVAAAAMDRYATARTELDGVVSTDALPWRVRRLLEISDELMPAAAGGLRLAPHIPTLLGQDGPRRYLLMAQNEDEIRATGGFLTGVGVLTVQNGQIVDLSFRDANLVDNWAAKPYEFPPQPLYDYMGLELFLFRDANFWPDFPTSARTAMDLFEYGQDAEPLDGAIAIDQEFLRLLVEATGPVPVPGTDQTINADNLIRTLQEARNIQEGQEVGEWVRDRKAFLGGFAAAILAKFETNFGSINPINLAANIGAAVETRHLSIFMRDPALATALSEIGWDGHLPHHPPGDFLMTVDSNMGYNKVGIYLERAVEYAVDLNPEPGPQALVTINYRHTGPPQTEPCYQGVSDEFEQGLDYLALADQCYWNYIRVYAPEGSILMDSSRHVVPGETMFNGVTWDSEAQLVAEQDGLTTFAVFLLVPQGGQETALFRYQLPGAVIQKDDGASVYQLTVYKQPGVRAEPLKVTISLPERSQIDHINPASGVIEGNRVFFETTLTANTVFTIRYR